MDLHDALLAVLIIYTQVNIFNETRALRNILRKNIHSKHQYKGALYQILPSKRQLS